MKLYEFTLAPNPRRVRIFLAEKGISVPTVQVDIAKGENRSPEFLAKNPMGGLPVLELDDGTFLAESVAICRYFEETQPNPPLFGTDAKDRALVEMWNRRMELNLLSNTAGCFRNTNAFFKGRIPQYADYGAGCKDAALKQFAFLDSVLADREYVAGSRYSIADITALVGVDFGRPSDIRIAPEQKNLARWHERVSSRPSAKA
jgi:glutathione S-transferase